MSVILDNQIINDKSGTQQWSH